MAVIRLMRPLAAILLFCSALRREPRQIRWTRRPSGPRPKQGRPLPRRTGVADTAGVSGAPRAPDPGAKSRDGNPLWTVPLSSLIRDPGPTAVFSLAPSPFRRRPIVAPPPKQEAPPPPPERPSLTFIGTIVSPKAQRRPRGKLGDCPKLGNAGREPNRSGGRVRLVSAVSQRLLDHG